MKPIIVDNSVVIGTTRLGEMYGKSWTWARSLLVKWHKEQLAGGPVRVFKKGKNGSLHTTIAVLQREMPGARDQVLVRKIAQHEKDLDTMARRVDMLTTKLEAAMRLFEPKTGPRLIATR